MLGSRIVPLFGGGFLERWSKMTRERLSTENDPTFDVSLNGAEDHPASKTQTYDPQNHSTGEKDVVIATEPPVEQRADPMAAEDYSVFPVGQKRAIIAAASFMAWFSPMSGSIYYPALNQIAADLKVSSSQVNITVTTYLVCCLTVNKFYDCSSI